MVDFISVPVPSEHVTKVYALLAELDKKSSHTSDNDDDALRGWTLEDLRCLPSVPRESVRRILLVMDVLAKSPGTAVSTTELADLTGLTRGQLRGAFSGFTRWINSEWDGDNNLWPFEATWGPAKSEGLDTESYYVMSGKAAELWDQVRQAA